MFSKLNSTFIVFVTLLVVQLLAMLLLVALPFVLLFEIISTIRTFFQKKCKKS